MRAARLTLVIFVAGCGSPPTMNGPPPATDPNALLGTLNDLMGFGEKRVGTGGGASATDYVKSRFVQAGLTNVHYETFGFPRHDVTSRMMSVTVDGVAPNPAIAFDVFEGSGPGHADGDLVWCNNAMTSDIAALDLTGKIALVQRDASFHRSTQYRNVAGKGAVAMLYFSAAPDNLIQVGSVRRDWETLGPIPAITIGAVDGKTLLDAVMAKKTVHAVIDVGAVETPATGTNVIGTIPGTDPTHEIVIGGHYDTWFIGSSDNGGGISAVIALAARRLKEGTPKYTLVFVGYDGEEVALYGGYDFLRKHKIVGNESILSVLNFEIPSVKNSDQYGLARSNVPALDMALKDADLGGIYTVYAGLELVPILFGGIIPTDIQGIYRNGTPTASTACDSPYYHTTGDTPDKVDTDMLASSVDAFDQALGELLSDDTAPFATHDPKLWLAQVTPHSRTAGMPLTVDVAVQDGSGTAAPNAPVNAYLLYDDFFEADSQAAMTDMSGKVSFTFQGSAADMGKGNRFLHVTSGPMYPLVEQVVALP
jgi:hypothetical protein